jgi:hypothetical protein
VKDHEARLNLPKDAKTPAWGENLFWEITGEVFAICHCSLELSLFKV